MRKITLNNFDYQVDEKLGRFTIAQPVSENVAFYGHNNDGNVFVQFRSGISYIYDHVSKETLKELDESDSPTHFIRTVLKDFRFTKFNYKLITPFTLN